MLAINSGSSSTKFAVFTIAPAPAPLCRGTIDEAAGAATIAQVLERAADALETHPLAAVGHRIVHGGPSLSGPRLVNGELLAALRQIVSFAPNHLPAELDLIEAAARLCPAVPQMVCFDTAFHSDLPDVARHLPIPRAFGARGVRRYGFHGLSYTFLLEELRRRDGRAAGGNVIFLHLGNGSSLAAVAAGRCIDTSMGFTPIGGVVMSTRSGDLDPGVVTYLARSTGYDADRLEHALSHESGLAGISGGVRDMRELLAREADDEGCRLAVAMYCYDISKRIGSYAAALAGLDALVFSGGIGEHAAAVRARICRGLRFLGIDVDDRRNDGGAPVISRAGGRVAVHVIPTDEEVVIAQAAWRLLQ